MLQALKNQLLSNKGHSKRQRNYLKTLFLRLSSSGVVGTGGKKIALLWGTELFHICCFGTSTNRVFLDPRNGKHWIKKLMVDYKPNNQLEHKAE